MVPGLETRCGLGGPVVGLAAIIQFKCGTQVVHNMKYFMIVLVFSGLVKFGSTIMCYECNSATNSLCLQTIPPDTLKRNCSIHDKGVIHTMCRKIIQHVDVPLNGKYPESRVIRTCGWDESKFKNVCYHRAGYGGRQEVCSCHTDYCNSAQGHRITKILLSTVLLVTSVKICY
ncbi:uncharacterized protein LOC101746240 [Bombyx mori]|uniref:Protein sleepless n=1 Tax=Bombyx mori TaxID=7091 RepID=A0A8R2G8F2_BOMMO|nr:uncharacterized protein LOC101746240 [Bombyx mori]